MDITRLPNLWRTQAAGRRSEATTQIASGASTDDLQVHRLRSEADLLEECADELEQAWHDHAHDGEWDRDCRICRKEMAEQG